MEWLMLAVFIVFVGIVGTIAFLFMDRFWRYLGRR